MTIKLHDLRPAPGSKTKRTRVGRGEGSKGKTAGRGTKGTKARKNVPSTFEGGQMPIHMRLPKLKGFRNRFRTEYEVVNVGDINRLFPEGGSVGLDELVAKGAVRKNTLVKVLGDGKLAVKVNVTAHKFSGSAREKITAAGGQATELEGLLLLRSCAQHVAEHRLAHREFPRIAAQVKAQPVHHIAEPDSGVGVGEAKRAAETWCAESLVGRPKQQQRHRL